MTQTLPGRAEVQFRLLAVLLTLVPAAMSLFSFLNNLTDISGTLEHIVYPMLAMKDTGVGPLQSWRAVEIRPLAQITYVVIMLVEAVPGFICAFAALRMTSALRRDADLFRRGVQLAQAGMLLGVFVWLFFFGAVAGDWFLVWRNPALKPVWTDSFQYSAMVALALLGLSLIDTRIARRDFL